MNTFETFADFLEARYAEQEATILACVGLVDDTWIHAAAADIEGKRKIVELHTATLNRHTVGRVVLGMLLDPLWVCPTCSDENGDGHTGQVLAPCPTLIALALPYMDHPDYRQVSPR